MRFGSLFAGIGGIDIGLERAGMECAWQVEIDDYCNQVLEKHWPDVLRYGNVRDVGRRNLEPVDLIAGGFPCQPHSVAGKRKGAADDRNLWPEFSRVIAELRPRYVLAENVPGIVSTYIDTVLSDLESQGYTCATFNIPACAFDAPHRRERIFIVAYSNRKGKLQSQGSLEESWRRTGNSSKIIPHAIRDTEGGAYGKDSGESQQGGEKQDISEGREIRSFIANSGGQWTVEPNVGRVAHGIPSRVDRLRALGNAVVPQVAEWIGKRIMEFDETI